MQFLKTLVALVFLIVNIEKNFADNGTLEETDQVRDAEKPAVKEYAEDVATR